MLLRKHDVPALVAALRAVLKVCDEEGQYAGVHPHFIRQAITEALS